MNSESPVRVRFAPSPTGFLHVGNVRTALFNWLLAGRAGGTFILRIEDTDAERSRPEYERQLRDDLLWLGLDWGEGIGKEGDCGPYRQSERYDLYRNYVRRLVEEDKAFRCFCSEEELERVRREQLESGRTTVYSGRCRHLPADEAEARVRAGEPFTVRLRVRPGRVGFTDLVFGKIEIETAQISDPVILRSDGSPTYNFCCVVDDTLMRISHVIRGDGHLSNTHRQVLIYEALGAPVPHFAHLSTILGPDGQKLSKRHGATSVEEFRRQGYLPQALVNYLALLGWSPPVDGQEVLSPEEITRQFGFDRVQKNPATFDTAKLDWMNRTYINKTGGAELAEIALEYYVAAGLLPAQPDAETRAWLGQLIDLTKTHVDHLDQLPSEAGIVYGFEAMPPEIDEGAREALGTPEGMAVALEFKRLADGQPGLTPESYRSIVAQVKSNTKQKGRNLYHPIRAALTGRGSGPEMEKLIPLYESGSRLALPRRVMSCRERLQAVLASR